MSESQGLLLVVFASYTANPHVLYLPLDVKVLPLRSPETCSWPKESHSRSRRYAAEAQATTSNPWISFSRCVEPAYQAKNSYWTVHAIATRLPFLPGFLWPSLRILASYPGRLWRRYHCRRMRTKFRKISGKLFEARCE